MYTTKERLERELLHMHTCGTCRWYDGLIHRCEAGMNVNDCLPDGCPAWETERIVKDG